VIECGRIRPRHKKALLRLEHILIQKFLVRGKPEMKRLAASLALALALTSTAALAEKEKQRPWTGFNVGLDSGYAWDPSICTSTFPVTNNIPNVFSSFISFLSSLSSLISSSSDPGLTPSGASALSATGCVSPNVGGVIGGGQIGYNYQIGDNVVTGIEADFQGAGVQGGQGFVGKATSTILANGACSSSVGCADPVTSFVDNEKSIHWLGTVRPRLGFLAMPNLLVYATGGLAYGGVAAGTSIFQSWGPNPFGPNYLSPAGAGGHFSGTQVGWTIGGGLEWLFLPNWSVKFEYLHYDLGSAQFASGPLLTVLPAGTLSVSGFRQPAAFDTAIATTSTRFYGETVRAGVNYHFNF
jgi:outer membrane immunogenic protein